MQKNVLIHLFMIFLIFSCASSKEKTSLSSINAVEVGEKILKGKTTQAQVMENFGTPDVVEKTDAGDVWGYNRSADESSSFGGGITQVYGYRWWDWSNVNINGDKSSSARVTKTLVIHFSKEKIVNSFNFRTERI